MAETIYCAYRGSQELLFGKIPLGRNSPVNDADVVKTVVDQRVACSEYMARFARIVFVSKTKRQIFDFTPETPLSHDSLEF